MADGLASVPGAEAARAAEAAGGDEYDAMLEEAATIQSVRAAVRAGTGASDGAKAKAKEADDGPDDARSAAAAASAPAPAGVDPDAIVSTDDLETTFREAQAMYDAVEASPLPGGDAELQASIQRCVQLLLTSLDGVRKLHVFSKNEAADDVDTRDLPYCLIAYYLGKLHLRMTAPNDLTGAARLSAVQKGRALLDAFLDQAKLLALLDADDTAVFDSYAGQTLPPQLSRDVKMARFRKSRDAKQRLQQVGAKLQQGEDGEGRGALERESVLLTVDCAVKNALDDFESTIQEEQILQHMASMKLQFSTQASVAAQPPSPKKPLVVTKIDKNCNMTRETVRDKVFQPSWTQPTMSLEEFADNEVREAMERQERQAQHQKDNPETRTVANLHEEGLEDDQDLHDQATKKDRDWDDWKDDHPKGRGVTKRF